MNFVAAAVLVVLKRQLIGSYFPSAYIIIQAHLAVQSTFSANFPIYVHAVEYGRKKAFTTPELMERMISDYTDYSFKFVIGTDLLLSSEAVSRSNSISTYRYIYNIISSYQNIIFVQSNTFSFLVKIA